MQRYKLLYFLECEKKGNNILYYINSRMDICKLDKSSTFAPRFKKLLLIFN